MFCLKALHGFKSGCRMCVVLFFIVLFLTFFSSFFFKVCVKYSHFEPYTNLYHMCKSDNINVYDVWFTLFVKTKKTKKIANFWQKSFKKWRKKWKESAILR